MKILTSHFEAWTQLVHVYGLGTGLFVLVMSEGDVISIIGKGQYFFGVRLGNGKEMAQNILGTKAQLGGETIKNQVWIGL